MQGAEAELGLKAPSTGVGRCPGVAGRDVDVQALETQTQCCRFWREPALATLPHQGKAEKDVCDLTAPVWRQPLQLSTVPDWGVRGATEVQHPSQDAMS